MPDRPSGPQRFFRELRRRRVFRVAGGYALAAWIVIEAADVILPALRLPEWTTSFVVALALLGFPVALILAWAFDVTPQGLERTATAEPAPKSASDENGSATSAQRSRRTAWVLLGLLVAIAGAWLLADRDAAESTDAAVLDGNAIAVLPFRVTGSADDIGYLREGMVDLLVTKLTGEAGPRAVDSRTTLSVWRRVAGGEAADLPQDSARLVARRVGAGQMILGEIVSTPTGLVLSASLVGTAKGERKATATLEGPPDSLTALVDRLAVRLLAIDTGDDERLAQLTSTSLSALRAYLAGQAAYRRGRYARALEHYETAVAADSSFALAALGLAKATKWTIWRAGSGDVLRRALRLASAARDRLSPRDRTFLDTFEMYHGGARSPYAEYLSAWEAVVERHPRDAEAWQMLGEVAFFHGPALGIRDRHRRAEQAFERALELDSTFIAPLGSLLDIAIRGGERETVERRASRYLGREPEGFWADWRRVMLTVLYGDSAEYRSLLAAMDTLSPELLRETAWHYAYYPRSDAFLEYSQRAYHALVQGARTSKERSLALWLRHDFELDRGQPARALEDINAMARNAPDNARRYLRMRIEDALYWDGDSASAAAAAEALAREAEPPTAGAATASRARRRDLCALEQWRLYHGETQNTARTIATFADAASTGYRYAAVCGRLLETLLAAREDRPDAGERIAGLDSLLRTGPPVGSLRAQGNLTVARLLEDRSEYAAALRAARRSEARPFRSTFLRTQARLAARVGNREEAIEAYRDYLALRSEAEPAMDGEIERTKQELRALVREHE